MSKMKVYLNTPVFVVVASAFGEDLDFFIVLEAEQEGIIGTVVQNRPSDWEWS